MFNNVDWTKFIANLGGVGTGGLTILHFVPAEYQVQASLVLAVLSNLIGAYQNSVVKPAALTK